MEANHNFDPMMKQLIQLLTRILSHHFPQEKFSDFSSHKDKSINFNLYFLNVAPLPEDLEDWEDFEEDESAGLDAEADTMGRLNYADLEFLRRHGIRF
ncbi:MAG: hypothetical protein HYZ84_05110 [Candidatus Omnitrophica bacterium]|nr:hypothetical protein [Candidatus Omnitrophota bacterium]